MKINKFLLSLSLCFFSFNLLAQDVMLQGWYWDYPTYIGQDRYMKHLKNSAEELGDAGFTYIWLPPLSQSSGGAATMGYDIKDYYDLGQYASTRWGIRTHLDDAIVAFEANGLKPVADMVYNHRDAGDWEDNAAVKGWIEGLNYTKIANGDSPFPSDRYYCSLPLGGTSGNGAGTYYFKISSASGHENFFGKPYNMMMHTSVVDANYGSIISESEPNGGGDCGEVFNTYELGKRMTGTLDNGGCRTDEFSVTIDAADFNAAGDELSIRIYNEGDLGAMSDHRIYGIWNAAAGADVVGQLAYRTRTDFTNLASGRGGMTGANFKPNGNPTQLSGDQDAMFWFYDLDHTVPSTRDTLFEFTKWMWNDVGIRGFRVDAVKHFPAWFMGDLLDYMHDNGMNPGLVVGESYDFTASVLNGWLNEVMAHMDEDTKQAIQIKVFDFSLRKELLDACKYTSFYDVRNVFNNSIVDATGQVGFHVVTFLNNHDFREEAQYVDVNPELGYAYILTNNQLGIPTVFYPDYFQTDGMKAPINALMALNQRYIAGASSVEYLNNFGSFYSGNFIEGSSDKALIYQLRNSTSGREVIMAINFGESTLKVDHTFNTANFSAGDTLTDIFNVSPNQYAIVSGNSDIYMEIPPRSFAAWVQGDLANETISLDTVMTSIDDLSMAAQSLQIYPNPFSKNFQIDVTATRSGKANIAVFNTVGQLMYETNEFVQEGENRLKIQPNLKNGGLYFVKMTVGEEVYLGRMVKE